MAFEKLKSSCVGIVLAVLSSTMHAQQTDVAPAATHSYVVKLAKYTYKLDPTGRSTADVVHRFQVLQESALNNFKTYSFSYSTSVESAEVVEAYTVKKDGRRVDVPPGNYQKQTNEGRGAAGPFFSDRSQYTIVFPDLAVGDSIQVHYRTTEKEPSFPGHFSMAQRISPFVAHEDVQVTIEAPEQLALRHQFSHMKFSEHAQGGTRVLEWRYARPDPAVPNEDADNGIWSLDETPGLFVSTFGTYKAIADAYGARALPKARATAEIAELAATIIGDSQDPKEKARRIYEWVSRNITYGGNCIGVGAVVPRDLDVVLRNRMGDCKDHATLLQALLAAVSIRSEQVLINAGSDYELPEVPVVSMVNHVINYLPEWDLYVDATAKEVPFGYLPISEYAKPVLHVGRANPLARTPGFDAARNGQWVKAKLKVAGNGSAAGTIRVAVHGLPAGEVRAFLRDLDDQQQRDFVKAMLARAGFRGRGTLDRGSVEGLSDRYEFAATVELDNFLRSRSGVLIVDPVLPSPMPVSTLAKYDGKPASDRRQVCWGFRSEEQVDLELPANLELMSLPSDVHLKGVYVDYAARYQRDGSGIHVERIVNDKTFGTVCSIEMLRQFTQEANAVGEQLRTPVLYKWSPQH